MKMRISLRKVFRDLFQDKKRSLLLIVAIALGVTAVGTSLRVFTVMKGDIAKNFTDTTPASAIFESNDISYGLAQEVSSLPEVRFAASRRQLHTRLERTTGDWIDMPLFVLDDFENQQIAKVTPAEGKLVPGKGEILIERQALEHASLGLGDEIRVKFTGHELASLQVVGSVHDPAQAPAWMENMAYGYISRGTMSALIGDSSMTSLLVVFEGDNSNQAQNQLWAASLVETMSNRGHNLKIAEVPIPGIHIHQRQMDALVYLVGAFGLLLLLVGAVMITLVISAFMGRQVRQIGVMQAIGGSPKQIANIYFKFVALLGLGALLVSMPLTTLLSNLYTSVALGQLNFDRTDLPVAWWVYASEVLAAVLIPLACAILPVSRITKIPVRKALSDLPLSDQRLGHRLLDKLSLGIRNIRPSNLLPLRNAMRRPGRFALTITVIVLGGMIFISALNVRASWDKTLATMASAKKYDVLMAFDAGTTAKEVRHIIENVEGVTGIEVWYRTRAAYTDSLGRERSVHVLGIPVPSRMVDYDMASGRWMNSSAKNEAVVVHTLAEREPLFSMANTLDLEIGGETKRWEMIGTARVFSFGYLMVSADAIDPASSTIQVAISSEDQSYAGQREVKKRVELALASNGIDVVYAQETASSDKVIEDHVVIVSDFLIIVSFLIGGIGGLGLAMMMSLSIYERTREIGVMRATGSSTSRIKRLVMLEGAAMGVLSWVLAALLSIPVSNLFGNTSGQTFIATNLDFSANEVGYVVWLLFVLLVAAVACAVPASKASRVSVREALSYE